MNKLSDAFDLAADFGISHVFRLHKEVFQSRKIEIFPINRRSIIIKECGITFFNGGIKTMIFSNKILYHMIQMMQLLSVAVFWWTNKAPGKSTNHFFCFNLWLSWKIKSRSTRGCFSSKRIKITRIVGTWHKKLNMK